MPGALFQVIEAIAPGKTSGPGAAVLNLSSLLPPDGSSRFLTFICAGSFEGAVAVQGSSDGSTWGVLASFQAGKDGAAQKMFDAQTLQAIVKFIRIFTLGTILAPTIVTIGAINSISSVEGVSGGVPVPVSGSVSVTGQISDPTLAAQDLLLSSRLLSLLEEQAELLRELVIHHRSITSLDLSKSEVGDLI